MNRSCFERRRSAIRKLVLAFISLISASADDISTAQVDAARTMAYPSEIRLTTSNLNGSHFGKLFSRAVAGVIYGQPLYLDGGGKGRASVLKECWMR